LGAIVAKQLGVPLVSSWHTDLHKYAGRRLAQTLWFLPKNWKANLDDVAERNALRALRWFYGLAKVTLAPNPDLVTMLEEATGKPCFLMRRGIDTSVFFPARRNRAIDDGTLVLGYVGRLSPEKGVGLLAPLEQAIRAAGIANYKFLIVGQGAEREALAASLKNVEFTGVLKGEALARAYANMDLFVFPSRTDTFGNVIQEALASGVPAVVFAEGGPKFLVDPGTTGLRAESEEEFCQAVLSLMRDRERRLFMAQTLRESTLDRRWESVFEEVYEAYRQSLKPRPAPARFSSQPA
jgi:glycosyltransferase involved in cell wall biosynthesis